MGVDDVQSESAHVSAEKISIENGLNGGLGIKFGSHGTDEAEANSVAEANFPKDAVDEWPAPKQIHSFYFVKFRSYDDQKLRTKLDQADKELQKVNQARSQIIEKLKAKRTVRSEVITNLISLSEKRQNFRSIMDEKRKEMEPLTQALGKLRGPNNAGRERGSFVCSSEEELNSLIKSLNDRIAHETIPLTEEKQILREIKQLEGTRDKVIANAAMRAQIQNQMGQKEIIQDQVNLMGVDLDGVRKDQQVIKAELKQYEQDKAVIDKGIAALDGELSVLDEKREKAFARIRELRKQREDGNSCFYQNRSLLIKARDLAAKKDVEALQELYDTEVEKFMASSNSDKAFRDDYEKRILPSLDMRQLSRDARMRNPDEKPLVSQDAPTPSEPEIIANAKAKQPKEDPDPPAQHNVAPIQQEKNSKPQKEANGKVKGTGSNLEDLEEDGEEIFGLEKAEKHPQKTKEVDAGKLKEMKREAEIAKAKQASERKKKLAEKAAAKAAIKAQKEAEKKLKDREKKAKKKLQASAPVADPEEAAEEEAAEPEKAEEETVVAPVVPSKSKERKENTVRQRGGRARGPESLSKVILKRKKSTNYWLWAAPAAVSVVLLLVVGYNYLL